MVSYCQASNCLILIFHHFIQARGTRGELHGHLNWPPGALLHGGPPQQHAKARARVGRPLRLRSRAELNQHRI